ncbi:MAG: PAS domain S-box protein [Herminiimonas sp.]|nr:PAS domain S-box protein [Herminiimonas sp.]
MHADVAIKILLADDLPVGAAFQACLSLSDGLLFAALLEKLLVLGMPQSCRLTSGARILRMDSVLSTDGTHCQAMLTDISEAVAAEVRHATVARRLAALLAAEHECVTLLAHDGSLLEMNATGLAMWQAESFDAIAQSGIYPIIAEEFRQAFQDLNHRVFDGESGMLEFQIVGPRGGVRWLETRACPLPDADGNITAALGVTRDVTERIEREAQLRLLESCIACVNDVVLITEATPTDAPGPRILFANAAFEKLSGYDRAEVIGRSPRILQGAATDRRELDRIRAAIVAQVPVRAEVVNYSKSGQAYLLEIDMVPIFSPAGVATHFVAIERDITARKAAEEIVATANQELARSNLDLEQFAYAASHDLQEPLRAVSSCLQLLQMRYSGKIDARADEFIDHAVSGSQRMQMLIDDLLAYSRIGSKPQPPAPVDTAVLFNKACANLRIAIAESKAQLSCDPLPMVNANAQQVVQLFQNLLGNALKFRGSNPARVHASARRDGDSWIFSIRDEGIGIEEEHFSRIFQLFKRLHTREEYPGTGIGLTICLKIIERHGGRIWVESTPGEGATFYFSLAAAVNDKAVTP